MVKRRICIFCEVWASGGIEAFLSSILPLMNRQRLQIDLVAAEIRESLFREPLERIGVRFIELTGNRRRMAENRRRLEKLLREQRYDVFHANLYHGLAFIYIDAARQAGVPIRIAHSHSTALRMDFSWLVRMAFHKLGTWIFGDRATDYWACSRKAADFLFLQQTDVQIVPNGIEIERFRFSPEVRKQVRSELGLDGKLTVGNVGRLCFQKNQTFLLDVFIKLLRQHPKSVLLLVGDGEKRGLLRDKIRKLGIESSVILLGVTDQVERYYSAMDVFAFPSRFEGLGIAAIEAQASGLPVLCSEQVPEETRILPQTFQTFPLSAGAESWAEKLLEVYAANDKKREKCADLVRECGYDRETVSRKIEAFYLNGKWGNQRKGAG